MPAEMGSLILKRQHFMLSGQLRTVVLVLLLDGPHAAGGPARHAAGLREVLRKLAQLVHVVRAQLGQNAGQQLVQLCMQDTLSASAHIPRLTFVRRVVLGLNGQDAE